MHAPAETILARLSRELTLLEKRDWELWGIVSLTGVLAAAALLALLLPAAFLRDDNIHFQITVSRPLAIGLFVLLALLNTYLVTRRFEVRRLREEVISTTLQKQLIEQQSFTDPLTEIYNRRSLEEITGRFIAHARRQRKPLTLMMVDLDNFKQVNTRFGHLTGDLVLSEFASLLKASIRGSDAAVRYGGDEFVIILADTKATEAERVIERISAHLVEWNRAGNLKDFELTVSVGITEWQDGQTLDEMLDCADRKMYEDKGSTGDIGFQGRDLPHVPSVFFNQRIFRK
jgi:diguanylate cyclase (GGDEF)-like protein